MLKKCFENFIMILLIVILIIVILNKYYYHHELIKIGGISFLIVNTGSMEPTIYRDEMIIIKKQNEYNKGDIITYKDQYNVFITHRIVEKNDNNYITRGDSNTAKDNPINVMEIEGKVIIHSAILGYFYLHILKPFLIMILIIYILRIINYYIIFQFIRKFFKIS